MLIRGRFRTLQQKFGSSLLKTMNVNAKTTSVYTTSRRESSFWTIEQRLQEQNLAKSTSRCFRLVLTGGPCAGKSTVVEELKEHLESLGFSVLHVTEAATSLKLCGMEFNPLEAEEFQKSVMMIQKTREEIFLRWAEVMAAQNTRNKTVIIYDRGLADGRAFVKDEVFKRCLDQIGLSTEFFDIYNRYDAVFHLSTVADGQRDYFVNTSYRHESPEEALKQDHRLRDIWKEHPIYYNFPAENKFQTKANKLKSILSNLLGVSTVKQEAFAIVDPFLGKQARFNAY